MPQPHQQADRRAYIVHDLIFFHRFSPAFQSRVPLAFVSSHSEKIDKIYQQYDKLYRAQNNLKLRGAIPADEGAEVMQSVEQYAGDNTAAFRKNQSKYHSVNQREADLKMRLPKLRAACHIQDMAEPEKNR